MFDYKLKYLSQETTNHRITWIGPEPQQLFSPTPAQDSPNNPIMCLSIVQTLLELWQP